MKYKKCFFLNFFSKLDESVGYEYWVLSDLIRYPRIETPLNQHVCISTYGYVLLTINY